MRNLLPSSRLGLFFTKGVSLQVWHEKGLLDRELKIYEEHLKSGIFTEILWFTYGRDDLDYQHLLPQGIQVVPMPKLFRGSLGNILYSFVMPLWQRKRLRECSIYKTNQMGGSWAAVISKWLYRKPLLVRTGYTWSLFARYQGQRFRGGLYRAAEKLAYANADAATVASKTDLRYVQEQSGARQVVVNPNYIDTDLFSPRDGRAEGDLVFIGRLDRQKNLEMLIDAVAWSGYRLDIYGDGPLKEALIHRIRKRGAQNTIALCGVIPNNEVPELLARYRLFVLPSKYEGMPKSLLEAMSCGKCCLGTRVPGIEEVIESGKNGWLVDPDVRQLEEAIVKLMNDDERRFCLGLRARQTILDQYSLPQVVAHERQLYEKMA